MNTGTTPRVSPRSRFSTLGASERGSGVLGLAGDHGIGSMRRNTEHKQKSPPRPEPGGRGRRRPMLLIDPVGALAFLGFEGLDGVPSLLHRASHKPADRVLLP